jgi:phospholipid transport system substrate-binding protein
MRTLRDKRHETARPNGRRTWLVVALALAMASFARPALADCQGARDFVRGAGDRAVAVLNATGASDKDRLAGMTKLLFEVADVPLIARLVLGRHWRSASDAQRTAYLAAFRAYAIDSLAYRFANLGGGVSFAVLDRCTVVDERDTLLASEATVPDRPQPVRIDWRVRETDGRYILVDVALEGVSLVVTNRSEFDSVVSRQGLDALIAQIQGKSPR